MGGGIERGLHQTPYSISYFTKSTPTPFLSRFSLFMIDKLVLHSTPISGALNLYASVYLFDLVSMTVFVSVSKGQRAPRSTD